MLKSSRGFAQDIGGASSPARPTRPKPGFASEIAEFHPDRILHRSMESFKAAAIAKAKASGASDRAISRIEFHPDIVIDSLTKEVVECPLEELGFKYVRFGRQANEPRYFAVYRDPFDGEVFQIYTSWQRWDVSKKKYGKPYLFAPKSSPVYTDQGDEDGSPDHIITEGKNKVDFLAAQGFTATSLTGVNGGYRVKDENGRPCPPRLAPEVKARLEAVGAKNIYLWMDSDEKIATRSKVDRALQVFGGLLELEGYRVKIVTHDEVEGKGLDDAGMSQPEDQRQDWIEHHLDIALTLAEWKRDRRKIRFMNYLHRATTNQVKPERETQGGYLPELPCLTPKVLHFVDAGTGVGKTTELKRIVAGKATGYTVIFAPSRSVGKAIAKSLGIPHISECDKSDPDVVADFWKRVHIARGIVLCIDSIDAITDCERLMNNVDLSAIDEVNQCLENLATGGTTKGDQARVLESFAGFLRRVGDNDGAILAAEAGIHQHSIDLLKSLSGFDAVRMFKHKRTEGFNPQTTLYQGSLSGWAAKLVRASVGDAETPRKKIFAFVSSQKVGEQLHRYAERYSAAIGRPLNIVRVDSKTNDFGDFAELFGNPNECLESSGVDLLIASPSIPSGVSFDAEFGYFDEVWGAFTSGTPNMWAQQQARVRADVPRHLFVKHFIQANDMFEASHSERNAERLLKSNQDGFGKAFGIDVESLIDSNDGDLQRRIELAAAVNKFLAVHFTQIGCQKAIAKDWFTRLLQSDGHQITEEKTVKVAEIQEVFTRITEELEREKGDIIADLEEDPEAGGYGDGIIAARLRSPEMVAKHYRPKAGRDDGKTYCPTWIRNLLHFKQRAIESAPGVDFDSPEICYKHLCKDGGRQWRGALLQAMSEHVDETKALERDEVEGVLTGRIVLPHRLPRNTMKANLIKICGISALLDGESYSNSDPRAIAIKETALHWKGEIYKWLRLSVDATQSPVEICNKLLHKLGLDAVAIARPGTTGKRDRIYQIPNLADPYRCDLLDAMRRRLRGYDVESIQDAVEMLRGAGDDVDALQSVWDMVQTLPECDRCEIWARLSEDERRMIVGLEEAIAA